MTIQNLKLVKFRNHESADLSFSDGVNLIIGPNGCGKTNILEAINLLSTGKSFRARYDHEMIFNDGIACSPTGLLRPANGGARNDKGGVRDDESGVRDDSGSNREFARIVGLISNANGEETLEIAIVRNNPNTNMSQKTFKVNGTAKPVYETARYFSTVLFCPQDLDLFNGSPTLRRRFMDDLLCKVDQKYKKEHTIYTKALRQRNKILEKINKTGRGADELTFWTDEILEKGSYLQEKRTELTQTLNDKIGQIYCGISSQVVKILIEYKMNAISRERLEKHHEHEIFAKTTLVGPHRDDFDFLVNGFSISHYGSRGQQRTGVLGLKICELNIIEQKNSASPVLLLDDIFSELDDTHKKSLKEVVRKQQTIITSTHPDIDTQNTLTL